MIIAGLPRTGSTFLHRLLAADETARAPSTLTTAAPMPAADVPMAADGHMAADVHMARMATAAALTFSLAAFSRASLFENLNDSL